jgi:hypothetical protein
VFCQSTDSEQKAPTVSTSLPSSSSSSSSETSSLASQVSSMIDFVIARSKDFKLDLPSAVMKWAKEQGIDVMLNDFLDHQRRVSEDPLELLITWTCMNGYASFVKLLLLDPRIDPSCRNQFSFCRACHYGHTEVVKLLLADKRVDPSADNQYSIGWASHNGHDEVVKLLLADKRVDPSANEQESICWASRRGHAEIVKMLLADPRVDPSAYDNQSVRYCSGNGQSELVQLLLADQRVVPPLFFSSTITSSSPFTSILPSNFNAFSFDSFTPAIQALFFLRRLCRLEFRQCLDKQQLGSQTFSQLSTYRFVVAHIEKIESQRKALLDAQLLVSDLSALCLEYVPDLFCHDASVLDLTDVSKFPRFSFACLSTL